MNGIIYKRHFVNAFCTMLKMQAYNKIPSYFLDGKRKLPVFMHFYETSVVILIKIFLTITNEKILCTVV